jgi:hypothetical protein
VWTLLLPHLAPKLKNIWSHTSTPSCAFMAWCLFKDRERHSFLPLELGYAVAELDEAQRYKSVGRGFIGLLFPASLWSWGWLNIWQKWVPEMFTVGRGGGGKGGRWVRLTTLLHSCANFLEIYQDYLKSVSLNNLETSGSVRGLLYVCLTLKLAVSFTGWAIYLKQLCAVHSLHNSYVLWN